MQKGIKQRIGFCMLLKAQGSLKINGKKKGGAYE